MRPCAACPKRIPDAPAFRPPFSVGIRCNHGFRRDDPVAGRFDRRVRRRTQRPPMASRRPIPRRLGHDGGGHSGSARYVLFQRRRRRRLENDQFRRDVAADVRGHHGCRDRRHRNRAFESENPLCRRRPSRTALRHRVRQRRVQDQRRRRALAERRAQSDAAHRCDPDRSPRRKDRSGRCARPYLRAESRPWRVPYHGWRRELEENALCRQPDGSCRSCRRSCSAEHRVRIGVDSARLAVAQLFHAHRRRGQRDLRIARRRRDVEASERRRLAARKTWSHRTRRNASEERRDAYLCFDRLRRARRPLSLRRCRRALAKSQRREGGQHMVREPTRRRAERSRHALHGWAIDPQIDRRRQDIHDFQRRTGRRRLPLRLDQPETPEPHHHRERSGYGRHCRRRRALERLVQPTDRSVLPSRNRQSFPVLDLFRPAGFRHGRHRESQRLRRDLVSATGIPSAATSATTIFRSGRSEHCVRFRPWLAHFALGCEHGRSAERFAVAGFRATAQRPTDSQIPLHVDFADRILRARAVRALRRARRCCSARTTKASTGTSSAPT